jgi:hypothetical protein
MIQIWQIKRGGKRKKVMKQANKQRAQNYAAQFDATVRIVYLEENRLLPGVKHSFHYTFIV